MVPKPSLERSASLLPSYTLKCSLGSAPWHLLKWQPGTDDKLWSGIRWGSYCVLFNTSELSERPLVTEQTPPLDGFCSPVDPCQLIFIGSENSDKWALDEKVVHGLTSLCTARRNCDVIRQEWLRCRTHSRSVSLTEELVLFAQYSAFRMDRSVSLRVCCMAASLHLCSSCLHLPFETDIAAWAEFPKPPRRLQYHYAQSPEPQ